jgi:hypothetical protein
MRLIALVVVAVVLFTALGCSRPITADGSQAVEPAPTGPTPVEALAFDAGPAPVADAGAAAAPPDAAASSTAAEVVVARILEAGPSGSGNCVQRSYQVERVDGQGARTEPFWVHFEACQGAPPPSFDGAGLVVGQTYRLRLQRGASSNFPDGPMILDAAAP